MNLDAATAALREFAAVVQALRHPATGCPWDLEQDHRSLRTYLVEETHEVLDAIDRGDDNELRDELGDLLLQILLHAQIADDRGAFSLTEVAQRITEKMIRRHPHVFGSTKVQDADEVKRNWERIKAEERRDSGRPSTSIPIGLPALRRAQRLGKKANRDPDSLEAVNDATQQLDCDSPKIEEKLGDLLFTIAQFARGLKIDAEDCLRAANRRFQESFSFNNPGT